MTDHTATNRALVQYLLLPTLFLTAALLGGLRLTAATEAEASSFQFTRPPLVALILSVLLMLLFARGRLVEVGRWLSAEHHPLTNVAHALTLLTLFFASAQVFNSVLPEAGLLRWMFSFFFLWTLWNNLFSIFDARRLLRSLAVLFGTAFILKHLLLAALFAPEGGWLKRLTAALLEGVSLGTFDSRAFAPANGYISFFAVALYVVGLLLLPPAPAETETTASFEPLKAEELLEAFRQLPPDEQLLVSQQLRAEPQALIEDGTKQGSP